MEGIQGRPAGRSTSGVVAIAIAAWVALAASPARAVVLPSQLSCQQTVSKAGRTYLAAVFKLLTRCRAAGLAGTACSTIDLEKSLADAAAKHDAKLARPCGALPQDALVSPRPAGLSLAPIDVLGSGLRSSWDRIARSLVDDLYGRPGSTNGATTSAAARACQGALDAAVAKQLGTALSEAGSRCHDLEDRGKTVVDETSRIAEACLAAAAPKLASAASRAVSKLRCTDAAIAELRSCDRSSTTVAGIADCLFARANLAAGAALAVEHGRRGPRVQGRIETPNPWNGRTVNVPDALVRLRDRDGGIVDEARSGADGRVELHGRPLERLRLCWERGTTVSCSKEEIAVGLAPVSFVSREVAPPLGASETAWIGKVQRSDGSPCFDGSTDPDFALRGGVTPISSKAPAPERFAVNTAGEFVAIAPAAATALAADCGEEAIGLALPGASAAQGLVLRGKNEFPKSGGIGIADAQGRPVTDPDTLSSGELLRLEARFTDPESDPLDYRWEIASGPGSFESTDGKPLGGDPRRASGRNVALRLGAGDLASKVDEISVRVFASDRRGGLESAVLPIGPIGLAAPCLLLPKLDKLLCGAGYDASVPEPAGERKKFLTYEYRNPTFNSAADACAYYNLVDPQCIDLDCDGLPDPGTDPSGLCKRTTLGGWWQKNGFDPTTGLGPDVTSAWYLNSNDLGFGREMHCRVTGWRTAIADRPAWAPLVPEVFLASLRPDLVASSAISDWKFALPKFPATVACYVVNYTTDFCFNYPTNDPQNADLAWQGQQSILSDPTIDPVNAYGTVAMEFAPVEGFGDLGPITKFFVYDGRIASGKRLGAANLDGCGAKSVPEVCMSCHGGKWPGEYSQNATIDSIAGGLSLTGTLADIDANDTAATDAGYQLRRSILEKLTKEEPGFSSFLPFDPATYKFPAAASSASQASSIRRLNQLVLWAKPTDAIRDLVRGWYGNDLVAGTFAPWRPSAWNDDGTTAGNEADLYDHVYAVSCRGCHAAHYSMDLPAYFPGSGRLCVNGSGEAGGSPTMPHAKLTYLNLWKSDFPQSTALPSLEAWYLAMEPSFTSCD